MTMNKNNDDEYEQLFYIDFNGYIRLIYPMIFIK